MYVEYLRVKQYVYIATVVTILTDVSELKEVVTNFLGLASGWSKTRPLGIVLSLYNNSMI